jgi:hypothetical protein
VLCYIASRSPTIARTSASSLAKSSEIFDTAALLVVGTIAAYNVEL